MVVSTTLKASSIPTLATIPLEIGTEYLVGKLGGNETVQQVSSFSVGLGTSATIGACIGGPIGAASLSGVYVVGKGVSWGIMSLYRYIFTSEEILFEDLDDNKKRHLTHKNGKRRLMDDRNDDYCSWHCVLDVAKQMLTKVLKGEQRIEGYCNHGCLFEVRVMWGENNKYKIGSGFVKFETGHVCKLKYTLN